MRMKPAGSSEPELRQKKLNRWECYHSRSCNFFTASERKATLSHKEICKEQVARTQRSLH